MHKIDPINVQQVKKMKNKTLKLMFAVVAMATTK